jgi:beta-N-acetylhexosaminidase
MSGRGAGDPAVRRLVDNLLVPGLCGDTMPTWLEGAADEGVAAVCWFSGESLADVRRRRPDLLVLADEEGGNVTRLEAAAGSSWPGNAALGAVDDVTATERIAAGIGASAGAAGIGIVLAPVVDVNSEPDNPVIGVRSFGADPVLVARHGAAFVRGVQSQGVAACAKHFPGHGATRTDSHLGLPVVDADRSTFLQCDVAPFAAAVDAGVRCVLTAHVSVPAVDPTAATMSAAWMAVLRGDLGFGGVVISDALDMYAISRGVGRGPGAVAALGAGVDLLCIGNPCFPEPYDSEAVVADVRGHVMRAIEDGSLPLARLEEAASRVTALATWLGERDGRTDHQVVAEARAVAGEVARRAVRSGGEVALHAAPHVVVEQRTDIAAGRLASPIVAALVARVQATTATSLGNTGEVAAAVEQAAGRPLVLVTDGLAGDAVWREVRRLRPDAVVVNVGPPGGVADRIEAPRIDAFGHGAATATAVADLLLSDWKNSW